MNYKIGDVFRCETPGMNYGILFMLAQVDTGRVALISLDDGTPNRYVSPIPIASLNDLSAKEWNEVRGNDFFELVGHSKQIILPSNKTFIEKIIERRNNVSKKSLL